MSENLTAYSRLQVRRRYLASLRRSVLHLLTQTFCIFNPILVYATIGYPDYRCRLNALHSLIEFG